MTTTELYSGYSGKSSSRVLQPPGGGGSNIFGGEETDQRAQQPGRKAPPPDQNQNQGGPAEAAAAQQQPQGQQQGGQKRFKNRDTIDPAPYASFSESGKKSHPSQFDDCSTESQNDADFRCYSVTAYREAIATNAAVRQRARGSAAGATNPITHEEAYSSPFKNYEDSRAHPQQVTMDQTRGRKGQNPNQRRGQFNPITGEEYPDSYGQKDKEEEEDGEESKEQDKDKPTDTTEEKDEPKPNPQGTPAKTQDHNSFLVKKVRQPPGGASSGLW